jgi:cytochrome P450
MPLDAAYWEDRGPYLARLHDAYGPVVPALLGHTPVVFLLGPEANRVVLQTRRSAFSHRGGWDWAFGRSSAPPHLLTMDDPEHAWHRRLLHPAFAAARLDDARALIVRIVEQRLAAWGSRGVVDIYEEARVIALDVVAEALLGLHAPADRALCRAVYLHGAHGRAGEVARLLDRQVAERRLHPTTDALGLLAQAHDEGGQPLDAAQIKAHAKVLLVAGHETTASLAAWALYLLVQHPGYARRVLEECADPALRPTPAPAGCGGLSVLDRILREAERLYPPVPIAPRLVGRAVEVCGADLPAGTRVFYSAAATHLLSHLWADPYSFDPERFASPREEHRRAAYALVGFGGGPRICIGRSLARLELAIFVTHALQRYHLAVIPDQLIAQRCGVTSRPRRGIRLHVEARGATA